MAPGRYFWSATAGFSFIGPSVPLSDLSQMDISSDGGTVVFVEAVNSLALWRPATGQVSIGAPPNALWVEFPKIDATGDRVFASVKVVGQGGGLVRRDWMWTPAFGWVDFQEHLVQLGATGLTSGSTLVNPNVTLIDLAPGGNAAWLGCTTRARPAGAPR